MKILSINWTQCSTAALLVDGEIVACVSEERFTRLKNDDRYPRRAVEAVLAQGGVAARELDWVVFASQHFDAQAILVHKYSQFTTADRLKEQTDYWRPKFYQKKDVSFLDVFADKMDTQQDGVDWPGAVDFLRSHSTKDDKAFFQEFRRKLVQKHLGIDPAKVIFADHHTAHGHYGYYASEMPKKDPVLIMTADGWGDHRNATVSVGRGGTIDLVSESKNFQGARLYRSMTLLLGMKPDEHEYKVMGLAAYSKPEYWEKPYRVFADTQVVEGLGFAYKTVPTDLYDYFRDRFEGVRFDAIAGALQAYIEDILLTWTRNALATTRARRLVFSGGVGMNVKAMMRIAQLEAVTDMEVPPSPSDESLAMGAAFVVAHDLLTKKGMDPSQVLKPLKSAYLGPAYDESAVKSALRKVNGDRYRVVERPKAADVAKRLAEGKVVGRCCGRAEFGARALGNRSILADPRRVDVVRKINESIKSRDFWMPFAPSVLAHRADDYLANRKGIKARYMTQAFATTAAGRRDLIAGLHQGDLTCRPQILSQSQNPGYHEVIAQFEKLTGVGGVLNTSFNLHGEPIVQTPADALDVFQKGEMDVLVLDGCLVEKRAISASKSPKSAGRKKVSG